MTVQPNPTPERQPNPMDNFKFMRREQGGEGPSPEEMRRLKAPFPAGAIEWVISATNANNTKGLVAPYCNWTVYAHQLDEIFGTDWNFDMQYLTPKMNIMLVHLTIRGKTRTQIIVGKNDKPSAQYDMWSAGFRRACALWGLGAYLYHAIPKTWVALQNEKYIASSEYPNLQRVAAQFTDDWAQALEGDLMSLVAVSADPTPDFDEEPPLPTPEAPRPVPAPPPAPPAPVAPSPEPVREQSLAELSGIVLALPKAKKLTGMEDPTIYDVWSKGQDGVKYLEWVSGSGPENLRQAVGDFLRLVPDDYQPGEPEEPFPPPASPDDPPATAVPPAPAPDADGVVGDVKIQNMPELLAAVNGIEAWKGAFDEPGPLYFFCQDTLGWTGVPKPSEPELFAQALAWFAQNKPAETDN